MVSIPFDDIMDNIDGQDQYDTRASVAGEPAASFPKLKAGKDSMKFIYE